MTLPYSYSYHHFCSHSCSYSCSRYRIFFVLFSALVFLLNAPHTFAQTQANAVYLAINERLTYMEDVALYKAIHQKPIEDVTREQVVLAKAVESADLAGLDKTSVAPFFQAQIAVAKAIQYRYRADLLSKPTRAQPRDLQAVIRPALITLGAQINQHIATHLEQHKRFSDDDFSVFKQALTVNYLSDSDKQLLFTALQKITLK